MRRAALPRRSTISPKTKRLLDYNSPEATKARIQALLRQIVIKRDGGCVLRNERFCNGLPDIPGVVLQADHLITRANSATYADPRLVVCVCRRCHAWKSCGSNREKAQYDALVRTILPPDRVALWDRCEEDRSPHRRYATDWLLEEAALIEMDRTQSFS